MGVEPTALPSATLLLATRSSDKAREIRRILQPHAHLRLVTLDGINLAPLPEENDVEAFTTFLDNAHAKADFFLQRTGVPTLADDSGICVDALGGRPGVRSRRYAAVPGLDGAALDRANNHRLLEELRDVPPADRTAHYTCAAALHLPDGRRFAALGTCAGIIVEQPRGNAGFGYDPLFLIPDLGATFAELGDNEKNHRSHRARAFRALFAMFAEHQP